MNKKIKELIKQMGGIRYDDDNEEMTPMLIDKELETFAELIVKECAKQLYQARDRYDHTPGRELSAQAMELAAALIENHFGVE